MKMSEKVLGAGATFLTHPVSFLTETLLYDLCWTDNSVHGAGNHNSCRVIVAVNSHRLWSRLFAVHYKLWLVLLLSTMQRRRK